MRPGSYLSLVVSAFSSVYRLLLAVGLRSRQGVVGADLRLGFVPKFLSEIHLPDLSFRA